MSLPAVTQLPHPDDVRIRGLLKSLASGMIVPMELAERAYRMGSESCHRAMEVLADSQAAEPIDLSEMEKITISRALARTKGDKLLAARLLGIGKTTLYRKIAAYGIEPSHTIVCPSCGCEVKYPRRPLQRTDGMAANAPTSFASGLVVSPGTGATPRV